MPDLTLGHQLGAAAFFVWIIQKLKSSGWFPWINANSDTLTRIVSVVFALLVTAGFKYSAQGNFLETGGTIVINVPAISGILDTLMHTAGQLSMQEGIYRVTTK